MTHPIPQGLRDRFDQIELAIMRNQMARDAVFTQMRTAVQAYFTDHPAVFADPDEPTPAETLAGYMLHSWAQQHGKPVPWTKAVEITAIMTKMSDAERDKLLAMDDPDGPKCKTCRGHGVIGWTTGQTPESFDQGEAPCSDCDATGYARSNGMPVSGNCETCKGTGVVDDGALYCSAGGIPFESGPINCVKDCPDCANPFAGITWKAQGEANFYRLMQGGNWFGVLQLNGEQWREHQEAFLNSLFKPAV